MNDCTPGRVGHRTYVFLTEAEVKAVRVRAARGHRARVLAADFQVSEATIRNIVRRRTRRSSRGRKPCTFLGPAQVRALRGRARAGEDLHALAAESGFTWATAKNLRDGRTRRGAA
jgi:hypothetical protein